MCQTCGYMLKMAIADPNKYRCMEKRPQRCQKCGLTYQMTISDVTRKSSMDKENRLARNVIKSAKTNSSGNTCSSTTEEATAVSQL